MNRFASWFKSHNISSHAIAAVLTTAATAYASDDQVRSLVNALCGSHPKALATLGTSVALWLRYSNSSKLSQ